MNGRMVWARRKPAGFNPLEAFELRQSCVVLAVVQKTAGGDWFSYGLNGGAWNTASEPMTLEDCKKDAKRRALEVRGS